MKDSRYIVRFREPLDPVGEIREDLHVIKLEGAYAYFCAHIQVFLQVLSGPELFVEGGSLSDSGISDEGSEHELGERERRLATIRRLIRQLELVMAPDCKAKAKMIEALAAAEKELRTLQKKCRSLIVRTAVCAVAPPT